MALVDNAWYVDFGDGSTTGYYAVAKWATGTVYAAGALVRQNAAPTVNNERVFVAVVAGTSHATTEPTWTVTRGAKNTDNTVTWQECTGIAALNGDLTNTPTWTITATPPGGVKNTAVTLGQVISRDSGASYQICTTAGTAGNGAEPAFSNTAGTTTADNTVTWTSLGVVGNFTGWQAPHARLANAFTATWGQAGNSFYVASEHAETQTTAMTLTSPGTFASQCAVNCVTKTTVPPGSANDTTGATISTTGASNITFNGVAYADGLTFNAGSVASQANIQFGNASNSAWRCKSCSFTLNNTSASSRFVSNNLSSGSGVDFLFESCTFTFGSNTSQAWQQNSIGIMRTRFLGGSFVVGANVPIGLFNGMVELSLEGVDLSVFGATTTLVKAAGNSLATIFKDCKLGASVTVSATPTAACQRTYVIRTDSAGTNYIEQLYLFQGTQTDETTIVRTGGATDGTTVKSRKIVTTANSKWILPFESDPIAIWNTSTSAITGLTIYGTTTGGGVPKDDEIWIDVEYLGAAGSPLGSFKTSTKANNLAASAATNNSADGSTWGGGGAGNGFKIVCPSFTPGQVGYLYVYIKAAKATSTYYIDPLIAGVT